MIIKTSQSEYPIYIGENLRYNIKQYFQKTYSSVMIITDEHVANLYVEDIKSSLTDLSTHVVVIKSGEQAKQFNVFYNLHTEAIKKQLDRQSVIIALGGGVVGDIAGFVAATFMRGIDYIQVPTTILAHDSSVGGKVAINHELGKNLIGSFYPPVSVIYDIDTLKTLSDREVRSGYAEIMKEALIADKMFFNQLLVCDLQSISKTHLIEHLSMGIKIKSKIVMRDELESGERMYLNLGHTLGHALEAADSYQTLLHGEAVAIGLLFALYVSEQQTDRNLSFDLLYNWLRQNNYPIQVENITSESLINFMMMDKKVVNDQIRLILLHEIGHPIIKKLTRKHLKNLLDEFFNLLQVKGSDSY